MHCLNAAGYAQHWATWEGDDMQHKPTVSRMLTCNAPQTAQITHFEIPSRTIPCKKMPLRVASVVLRSAHQVAETALLEARQLQHVYTVP